MKVLVTGGAGYIGSHTCVELLNAGHDVVVVDDYSNSKSEAIARVQQIAEAPLALYVTDVRDKDKLLAIFRDEKPDAVIHFAGFKAVGESVAKPLMYYDNNLISTIVLLQVMQEVGCRQLVFSSSATVYGVPDSVPLHESAPLRAINPYGATKLMIEDILRDLAASDTSWCIALLRYFNPVGAHSSGRIGEDPNDIPNNLMPYISQVAVGRLEKLRVFGGDYDTPDGTGVRDYIHVVDLALGHLAALKWLSGLPKGGAEGRAEAINLGTGAGYSVLDMVHAFEKASGKTIPYEVVARRSGDAASCYADPAKAYELLGWSAVRDVDAMCQDAWRWQSQNPHGYDA